MISLIVDKYYKFKSFMNCGPNDTNFVNKCDSIDIFKDNTILNNLILNQFLFKLKVSAIELKDNIDTNVNNSDLKDKSQTLEIGSKEYFEKIKTMTVLESIQYLLNRKIDKNDQKYNNQFIKEGETGLDRVKLMFSEYFNGEDNPEMRFIMHSFGYGLLGGALYGGIIGNRTAVEDFMRRHNEYVFRGDFEAKRKIRDSMWLQFVRAGGRWSWRVALFSGTLSALTTTAIAYRNDVYISDCVISGALICSLWKMKLGLRAMAVSGVLGSVFGAIFGASLKLMLWTFNTTVPEYRYWRHLRYLGFLEVEKYSDGSTQYDWKVDQNDDKKGPNYPNLSPKSI